MCLEMSLARTVTHELVELVKNAYVYGIILHITITIQKIEHKICTW